MVYMTYFFFSHLTWWWCLTTYTCMPSYSPWSSSTIPFKMGKVIISKVCYVVLLMFKHLTHTVSLVFIRQPPLGLFSNPMNVSISIGTCNYNNPGFVFSLTTFIFFSFSLQFNKFTWVSTMFNNTYLKSF